VCTYVDLLRHYCTSLRCAHAPSLQTPAFRYRETHEKADVTWNANHTVTYRQRKWWYFDPENSSGSLKDNITTLNVVALVRLFVCFLRVCTSKWGELLNVL
jgi:hypothetical protein